MARNYQEFSRLHPLTLINRIVVSLPALIILFVGALNNSDTASRINLGVSIVFGMFFIPWILLSYFRFSFKIDSKEVTIYSGVVTRQRRNIPIERIQNVEIEQRFFQRLLGLAKVTLSTAGSAQAEGVLESVTLEAAGEIKSLVRQYQSQMEIELVPDEVVEEETSKEFLYEMDGKRVFLSGLLQFSLIYIVFIFSSLQYFNIRPEQIVDWFDRGELDTVIDVQAYPGWLLILTGVLVSIAIGWLSGMLLNLNRFHRFKLWRAENKVYKRHGLLTLSEDAIPIPKVHAMLVISNPLMRLFGWYRLEIQSLGVQSSGRLGRKVVMPLAKMEEIERVGPEIVPFSLPTDYLPVSKLTIRRWLIRLSVASVMIYALVNYFYPISWWWLVAAFLLSIFYSIRRYQIMGFNQVGDSVFVRYGVWKTRIWILEKNRIQSLSTTASFFQRRLALKDLIVDTAGSSPFGGVRLTDLPGLEADTWMTSFYASMQSLLDKKMRLKET